MTYHSKLTMIGHELDGISKDGLSIQGIIIAEIIDFKKHPNADRLSLCNVNIGSNRIIEVVCGAPNVRVGLKTAVFRPTRTLGAPHTTSMILFEPIFTLHKLKRSAFGCFLKSMISAIIIP